MPELRLQNELTRQQVQDFLRVKPYHLYILGRLDLQVNVYSQQVRAINLVHAIADSGDLELASSKIAVVGGGAAGLTAAATAGWLGFRNVTLYERETELLSIFRHNTVRHLHPHMYDWPHPGWNSSHAGLPILDWQAGTPKEVAQAIEISWNRLRDVFGIDQRNHEEGDVSRVLRRRNHLHPLRLRLSNGKYADYDVVILALGFGPERNLRKHDPGYWSNDRYEETRADRKHPIYLVSGCGDGGLVDYLRTRLRGFAQGKLVTHLLPDGDQEVEAAKRDLLQIEKSLWDKHPHGELDEAAQRWLFKSYWEIEARGIRERIEGRLRAGTTAYLTSREPSPLRPSAFILNRFLALQVLRVDGLEPDPRTGFPREDGKYRVGLRLPPNSDRASTKVIIRHGPKSALRPFRRLDEKLSKITLVLGRQSDSTRTPAWKSSDWQEASRRSALTQTILASKNLFDLIANIICFCEENQESPSEYWRFERSKAFIESKSKLATLFADLSNEPKPRELRDLITELSNHWTEFGRASITALLAASAFQEVLQSRLLMFFRDRFTKDQESEHYVLDIEPGSVVPALRRFQGPSASWLPPHKDYQVRFVWHSDSDLPVVNYLNEIGVVVPNRDHLHLRFGDIEAGWTARLTSPEAQLKAVLSLLDRIDDKISTIKALVMPELSAAPAVVEGLRSWLKERGASMILAAGSYHSSTAAEGFTEHMSALLIANSRGVSKHLLYKHCPCHFKLDEREGIAHRKLQITVHMSYSFSVVCILCSDLKQARTWEILPALRPGLILVPACAAESMDNIAYDLARSSDALVAIAYAPTPTPVTTRAAFVVGPAEEGPPVRAWRNYPLAPQIFNASEPGEETA